MMDSWQEVKRPELLKRKAERNACWSVDNATARTPPFLQQLTLEVLLFPGLL